MPSFRIFIKISLATSVVFFLAALFLFGSNISPNNSLWVKIAIAQTTSTVTSTTVSAPTEPTSSEKRQALEAQLKDLEKQIEENQKTISTYQKQGKTLTGEINSLNAKVNQLNLQIKAVTLTLSKLGQDITNTQANINQTENNIDLHRNAISKALQTLYQADQEGTLRILLEKGKLSDFFGNLNNLTHVQDNLRVALAEILNLKQQLVTQKEELSSQKADAENLRAIQQAQAKSVASTKNQKTNLLQETKGKETVYQKILAQNKASAAQIRSRIFQLLGGGELTFEKAYQYAKLAEGATGVRAAIVLAILNRESLLGKNVGRCSYVTAMNPTRDKPYFLTLLSQLNIDPASEVAKVSCPNAHGSYGGAMGPAQFIPSTWKLYSDKIAKVTNNNPPNPWNNADAFAATALYIKDLLVSSGCRNYASANKNVTSEQTLLERCAAAMYYAGGRWYTYRFWYGEPVVQQANVYESDIAILDKNS